MSLTISSLVTCQLGLEITMLCTSDKAEFTRLFSSCADCLLERALLDTLWNDAIVSSKLSNVEELGGVIGGESKFGGFFIIRFSNVSPLV